MRYINIGFFKSMHTSHMSYIIFFLVRQEGVRVSQRDVLESQGRCESEGRSFRLILRVTGMFFLTHFVSHRDVLSDSFCESQGRSF